MSAASAWEIVIKAALGKLPGALEVANDVTGALASQGFRPLDVTIGHVQRSGGLPAVHRDPFDRILAAQSLVEDLPILSTDAVFDRYGVQRVW